jgi:2TM domain
MRARYREAKLVVKGGSFMLTAEEYRQAEFGYTVAESRRDFRIHAAVYALVVTSLCVLNALLWIYADVTFPWAVSCSSGGVVGLTFHYIYGYRKAPLEAQARQQRVEMYAEHTKELV